MRDILVASSRSLGLSAEVSGREEGGGRGLPMKDLRGVSVRGMGGERWS